MLLRLIFCSILLCTCVAHSAAQTPFRGVVWDAETIPAVEDLQFIRQAGIQAIRLPMAMDRDLLNAADSMGLSLFIDLPFHYLPAAKLLDTLSFARSTLASALQWSSAHSSARHFGLSFYSDTSDESACSFFSELAGLAASRPDVHLYYVSPFVESDRCTREVDFVLLDARQFKDPALALERWPHQTPVGLGTLGVPAEKGAFGLKHNRSPQHQARFLESQLPALLNGPAYAVFVYRWQDFLGTPPSAQWGLLDTDGRVRPPYSVVQGLYTGSQDIFAFAAGSPAPPKPPWLLIQGWIIAIALCFLYAASVSWRTLVYRFLTRHGFYLDSIRRGRETPVAASMVFSLAQALIHGCTGWILFDTAGQSRALEMLLSKAPAIANADPWPVIGTLAVIYLAYQVITLLSSMFVLSWNGLQGAQRALIVQASAHWHCLVLLPLLMVGPSVAQDHNLAFAAATGIVWVATSCFSLLRYLRDLSALAPARRRLVAIFQLAPYVLVVVSALLVTQSSSLGEFIKFAGHLIMRP